MFAWVLDWMILAVTVVLAIVVALSAHRVFVRMAGRAVRNAHPVARSLFDKTAGPARLAFILLAIWLVMPFMSVAGLGGVFGTLFAVAVIGLIGWAAINATEMGAELYLKGLDGKTADDPMARRHKTQVRVVKRCAEALIVLVTAGFALMTFETGRQIGLSLFGMAGIAGLVAAFAAYPVLKNLVAGVQVAMTQPFRIGDIVEVDGQTGKIADVTSSSVVLMRLSDRRRLIVPLSTLTEKPFQNVPREGLGTAVTLSIHTNDTVPVERARQKLTEIVKDDPHWDGRVVHLEVADAKPGIAELRVLASAATPHEAWNLRCAIREKLITFLQREHPGALLGTHRQPNADIGPESPRAPGSIKRPGSRYEAGPAAVPSNLPVPVNRPPPSLAEQWRYSASAWTGALFTQARAWSRTFFMQAKAWSRAFFMERSGKHRHSRNSNTGRGVAG